MEQQIHEFLDHIRNTKGYARNTVEAYRNDLTQFMNFTANERPHLTNWNRVDKTLLQAYVIHLKERNYTAASVARKIAVIKTFFHYLMEHGLLTEDPTITLSSPKVEKRLPNILTPDQVERLLAMPANHGTPKGLRDCAILELLYASGLRVSELVALGADDVDLQERVVRCAGRGDRHRVVPIAERAAAALGSYLERGRPVMANQKDDRALFVNPRGVRLTRQGLWLIIKEYVKEAGIATPVTPHTLRHSFAAHMVARGADLQNVQRLLGHSNITTTQVYSRLADGDKQHSKEEPWPIGSP
jgi:integrase/recombinase XerD